MGLGNYYTTTPETCALLLRVMKWDSNPYTLNPNQVLYQLSYSAKKIAVDI